MRKMAEIAKAIAVHDGRVVNWAVETPLRRMEDIQPLCNEVDKYLLDHPGETITITIER